MRVPNAGTHFQHFLDDSFIFVKILHHFLNSILLPLVNKWGYMWEGLHVKWEGLMSQGLHVAALEHGAWKGGAYFVSEPLMSW